MNSLKNLEESMGCNTIRDDHGGGVIYQRVHMDKAEFDEMLRKVEEEYSDLQDENARLRSCLSDDAENARQIMGESAKLRELLKNALTYIEYEGCGVECPETGNSATLTPCDTCNRYETESCAYVIARSARELGIEVDE